VPCLYPPGASAPGHADGSGANPADAELVSPDAGGCPRLRTLRIGEAADEKGFKRPRMVAGERIRGGVGLEVRSDR
jgi:hypothetical protein